MLSSQASLATGRSNSMIKRRGARKSLGGQGRQTSAWLLSSLTLTSSLVIIGCVAASSILQQETNVQQQQQNQIQNSNSNLNANSPALATPIATPIQESTQQDLKQPIAGTIEQSQQSQQQHQQHQPEQATRQARSEGLSAGEPAVAPAAAPGAAPSADSSKAQATPATPDASPAAKEAQKKESQPAAAATTTTTTTVSSKKQPTKSSSSQSKNAIKSPSPSSNGKPRLQANLGSTILQGSVNQMSKHDAYSAIAEKHGALAQDAMRRSDKRRIGNGGGFGPAGIQKASGLGDIFNPVRQMSDGGLARTLGASMRSMMKSKYSVPAYVASALLGAVALMAFYESPISPLPVPPLPEAPAGRFPPEMPNLPPGTQVPFRFNNNNNQQQNYNQRSAFASGPMQPHQQQPMIMSQQQQPQVFFPAAGQAQARSQSASTSPAAGAASAISQVASNLLNVAKGPSQNAQRKSGPDFDAPKSLFNPSLLMKSSPLLMTSSGSSKAANSASSQNASPKSASSAGFLSYFGLGSASNNQEDQQSTLLNINNNNGIFPHSQVQSPFHPLASGAAESKSGQAAGASNSGFLSKFRSYFAGSSSAKPTGAHSSPSVSLAPAANSPSESSFNRINFIQALMKDASNSLPKFLTQGGRKPAASQQVAAAAPAGAASQQSQQSMANLLSASSSSSAQSPQMLAASSRAADMSQQQTTQQGKQRLPGQSSGFMKVAHALLDSFTSGIAQRNAVPDHQSPLKQQSAAINGEQQHQQHQAVAVGSPLQMASMVVSDLLANYPSQQQQQQQQQQQSGISVANNINNQQDQTSYLMSSVDNNGQQLANQAPISGASSAASSATSSAVAAAPQPMQESLARSSDTADIIIAADDASQAAPQFSNTNNQVSYSTSVQSHSQQSQQQQKQHSAALQQAEQSQTSSSPASSSSHLASSSVQQQHVRKTRSVGPDFGPSGTPTHLQAHQQQPSRAAQINAFVDYVADSYVQNKLLINFVMNQVGLSHAVPYVEQILTSGPSETSAN